MNMPECVRQDADLLTRSNSWLNMQLQFLETEQSKIGKEIGLIKLILNAKKSMYDNGLVAVHEFLRDENGEIDDMVIRLVKVEDAIKNLNKNGNDTEALMYKMGQMTCWESDRVDIN